jgi:predicted metal-dependent phosphoesterase TrpH
VLTLSADRCFDFHLHTRYSDGTRSPSDVLDLAAGAGLTGISMTDHDTVDTYLEHPEMSLRGTQTSSGDRPLPWVLPGVEFSTRLDDDEVHILGYFPTGISSAVSTYVEEILTRREVRMRAAIRKLRERGLDLSWEECAHRATGRVVNKNHLAQELVAKRYVGRPHRAYTELLGPEVVSLPEDTAQDVVGAVGDLGGISVWAHPSAKQLAGGGEQLRAAGLAGVEIFIPRRKPKERQQLAAEARNQGLLVTGGSDWHGSKSGPDLGRFRVAEANVAEFLDRLGK